MKIRAKVGIPAWVDVKRIQAHTNHNRFKYAGVGGYYTQNQCLEKEFDKKIAVEVIKRINK